MGGGGGEERRNNDGRFSLSVYKMYGSWKFNKKKKNRIIFTHSFVPISFYFGKYTPLFFRIQLLLLVYNIIIIHELVAVLAQLNYRCITIFIAVVHSLDGRSVFVHILYKSVYEIGGPKYFIIIYAFVFCTYIINHRLRRVGDGPRWDFQSLPMCSRGC